MDFSIIIPTYNRAGDLHECLESVALQTVPPKEVIVVDNGNSAETVMVSRSFERKFGGKKIPLIYIKNKKGNSLAVARNIGVDASRGRAVIFLDDDVVLDDDYICQIGKVYDDNPDAVAVQGYFEIGKISRLGNWLKKIFFLFHYEKDKCRVLKSVSATYPYRLKNVISCEWLSGANHSWRKDIVNIKYDEKLKKYSEGEDLDFSYRLFNQYPGKLFITPYARLVHKASPSGRVIGRESVLMVETYGLYLFFKLFPVEPSAVAAFVWSRAGKVVMKLASAAKLAEIALLCEAYSFCIANISKIKKGDLVFFNNGLLGSRE